ncbi:ATP-binding cassette domain-containing protein [Natronospira bacteriovora]|uniref:ATP-binding cassette domain-containing protein n=1 Tax=Natronospira bacteriovora TaxID=3069753 RepID=A0ABU0W7Z0_9GAMM|nr:ATP-binding cassette domain-containing protein [Natronospira sp. AB-CW4]MDQ2070028.1 ATP-binding cassette domain-containing protein [Natronospira sp. AB-CW4]
MIQLSDITLRRGTEVLLEASSATLFPGHKLGLVGPNGCGKSSLFALLQGRIAPDAGELSLPRDWVIAHMAQEFTDLERPAIDFVLDGDGEFRAAESAVAEAEAGGEGQAIARAHARYENAGGYSARARAGELLNGLGFSAAEHDKTVGAFSGGWRVRLGLAQALMCPSDLLLLDEPTNHLDLEAVLWLEDWLRAYKGTLLLVSHDREFLDAVVDEILHIEHQRLNHYRGNYSEFEQLRAGQLARQQAMYEKQQREMAHMQKFVDRFRYKATKAKAAQSRIKAMERMEKLAPAHVDSPFHFEFGEAPRAGSPLVSLQDVALGYGDHPILRDIAFSIAPGDRIGLLGPNGAGKSTLVRALAGELKPLSGNLHVGPNVRIGYFAQHQLEQLDLAASPLTHLQRLSPKVGEQQLRNFIGGFAFNGDMATDPVGPLSGGEKARLVLALLVWQSPNLLLLDEPTNHLDLEMRHALTMALQGFEGAVVTVSHDRHLLASTVDSYRLVAEGGVREFDGDLDDYRQWLKQRRQETASERRGATSNGNSQQDRKASRRAAAEQRAALKPLRDRVTTLMKALDKDNESLAAVEAQLADPALYESGDSERMASLMKEQAALRERIEGLEQDWMEAEEALDAARTGLEDSA